MDTPTYPAFEYDDDSWSTLSHWLTPQVRGWVYAHPLPCWQGDEDEIVKDIVVFSPKVSFLTTRYKSERLGGLWCYPQAF